jgi:hypothetical protein
MSAGELNETHIYNYLVSILSSAKMSLIIGSDEKKGTGTLLPYEITFTSIVCSFFYEQ